MNYLALLIFSLSLHPILVLARETISYILSAGVCERKRNEKRNRENGYKRWKNQNWGLNVEQQSEEVRRIQ